ncbi:hypothetical protein [Amycolatopsis saalfeldensis]|uniref:Uncharacterized protein n=1 Tax=Amycolatopsis saalfeldensis TaxID=394193 RepID=A0A1H8YGN5_9PSEU|nr:hypothetical protein [Amycolatopsis saalfeldensis]SEP51223.1 hypothetical protein SAMN04489732_115197 [Amycolatopsis saalfeldensis]
MNTDAVIEALLAAGVARYAIDQPGRADPAVWVTTVDGGRIRLGRNLMDGDGNLETGRALYWTRYDGRTVIRTGEAPDLASLAAEVARQAGIPGSIAADE